MERAITSYIYWTACCALLLSSTGCRLPKLFLTPPDNVLVYDTLYEQELVGQTEPDPESLEYDFKWRYRDSLAEPVTVEDYSEGQFSKWRVLFATNRNPQPSDGVRNVSYENDYSENLRYGRCSVTLTEPTEEELEAARPDGFLGKLVGALPQPWQREVIFDEAKYTSVENVTPLPDRDFYSQLNANIEASRQKDVLVFVHGFNVDFESSVSRLAQIARDMPFNGAIISYSWPSQGGVDNYQRDGEVVDDSIEPFMQFLDDLKANVPAGSKVNLVVHSMGNRLVMRSLSRLNPISGEPEIRFENIVLCAPDVGVDEFKRLGDDVIEQANRTTLYRCLNDSALIASSYKNGEERAGASRAPVIMEGLDTVECAVIDTSILGHSYYGSNPHMLRDLFCVVKEGKGASERPWMKKQKIPWQGHYWIISDWPVQLQWAWHFDQNKTGILQAGFEDSGKQTSQGRPAVDLIPNGRRATP